MSPREREVRRCATDLLALLSVTGIPVDPVWIARRQGLAVEEGPLPSGVYGALWKKGNRFGIIVSDACPTPGHGRFSLAHELGHYHIDGHLDAMFAGDAERVESEGGFFHNRKSRLEREADWFASELLVPASQLGPRIDEEPSSIGTLQSLADEFRTSAHHDGHPPRRTDRPGDSFDPLPRWPGGMGLLLSPARPARLVPCAGERAMPSRPAPKPLSLARDLPGLPGGETRSATAPARDWFDGASPHLEVEEDAVEMGSYGRVLTLLVVRGGATLT